MNQGQPTPDPLPQRVVLLRHDLPDGTSHFDLMFERSGDIPGVGAGADAGVGGLVTFRVLQRVDQPRCSEFSASRIGDHRPDYLTYEGPVSGGRGVVRRVASGVCRILQELPGVLETAVDFGDGPRSMRGDRRSDGSWWFRVGPA